MKVTASQIEGHLRRLDPSVAAYLFFGPDQGLATERSKRVMRLVVDDLSDPFRVADMDGDRLRQEPGRLIEEAQAMSMLGGRRVVRIRQAGDFLTKQFEPLLAMSQIEAVVIVECGDAATSSSLRRLFEKSKNALAIPCYRDEARSLNALIDSCLRDASMTITKDAREYLVAALGDDHELSRREVEKLILVHSDARDRMIEVDDVAEVVGDNAALAIDDWIFAVLLGDRARAEAMRERLVAEGQAPVRLLRIMSTTVKRLLALSMEPGEPTQAINQARPPIHFRQKPAFERALRRWTTRTLGDLLAATATCEEACKQTGRPPDLLLARYAMSASSISSAKSVGR